LIAGYREEDFRTNERISIADESRSQLGWGANDPSTKTGRASSKDAATAIKEIYNHLFPEKYSNSIVHNPQKQDVKPSSTPYVKFTPRVSNIGNCILKNSNLKGLDINLPSIDKIKSSFGYETRIGISINTVDYNNWIPYIYIMKHEREMIYTPTHMIEGVGFGFIGSW
jgi:hypothetical protein